MLKCFNVKYNTSIIVFNVLCINLCFLQYCWIFSCYEHNTSALKSLTAIHGRLRKWWDCLVKSTISSGSLDPPKNWGYTHPILGQGSFGMTTFGLLFQRYNSCLQIINEAVWWLIEFVWLCYMAASGLLDLVVWQMRAPPALVDCFFIAYSTIIHAPFFAYDHVYYIRFWEIE
jgi:hypothetical protein